MFLNSGKSSSSGAKTIAVGVANTIPSISSLLELSSTALTNFTLSNYSKRANLNKKKSTDTVALLTIGPSENIYIGIAPLSLLREIISFIIIVVVVKVLVRRYRNKHRHGKKLQETRRTFDIDS